MSIVLQGSTSGSVTLQEPAVAGTTVLDLPATSGTVALTSQIPTSKVLQVISGTPKTDTFTTSSSSFVDVTGLSVTITPTSATSTILVLFQVNGSQEVGAGRASLRLLRGSTVIDAGAVAGSRTPALGGFSAADSSIPSAPVSGSFLDSPATTSSTTYKIQAAMTAGSGDCYINRTMQDADNANQIRMSSQIIVMEISA